MRKKSKKLNKLEKERFSILTDNLEQCYLCGSRKQHLHEIYYGTKHRSLSMQYGCVIPLCQRCHNQVHNNIEIDTMLKQKCQKKFKEIYEKDFIEIFKRSYL